MHDLNDQAIKSGFSQPETEVKEGTESVPPDKLQA